LFSSYIVFAVNLLYCNHISINRTEPCCCCHQGLVWLTWKGQVVERCVECRVHAPRKNATASSWISRTCDN
jgi:hypothetical protein